MTPYLVARQQLWHAAFAYAMADKTHGAPVSLERLKEAAEEYAVTSIRTGLGSAERAK